MRINYNISSIIARNALNNNDNRLSGSIERLSSGLKINSAADDAAGLAISLKMNAQIKSLAQANQNANDGVSVVNTADGAMSEMHDILQRMNELAIQAANGTNADSDREQVQLEITQLVEELDRIAETTQFNAQNLLDGSFAYKGYTNTENIKVMSYSDGVASGMYAIEQLEYQFSEDKIKDYAAYIEQSPEGEVTHEEHYNAVSADDIQDALVISTAESGLKTFPEGAKVILDDENILIQAENDFQIKLTLNNEKAISDSGVTTTSVAAYYTTDCYRNVTVTSADGTVKYNISDINFLTETEADWATTKGATTIYSGSTQEGLKRLSDDFANAFTSQFPDKEIEVTDCTYDNATGTFSVTAKAKDGSTAVDADGNPTTDTEITLDFTVHIASPDEKEMSTDEYLASLPQEAQDAINADPLNFYLHSHIDTKQTTYTVGADTDEKIYLDLTGLGPMRLQVGANEGQVIQIEIPALQAINLGVHDIDISTEDKATAAIDTISSAIDQLSGIRAKIGAYANRIEHTITNLDSTEENMTAAYSRIMDVDMATEMTEYSTVQVLVQSSTAMLAQANERPQSVLQLLQ